MRIPKKAVVTALTAMLALTTISSSQAADAAPMDANPGPAGSFSWKGFNWDKRFWDGGPHYNRDYDAANVVSPDANGYVKLNITNPTGNAPVAAEFQSTRRGFGYGTYSTVVEKNVAALQKEVVWGCLFTYDPDAPPGFTELDLCEASAWGGGAEWGESWPVEQGHGYWFDASKGPGLGNNTINFPASNSPILTHKMVWEPGKITFETYSGTGYSGPLLKRTVLEGPTVPMPAKEHVIFNFWVTGGGGGKPNQVKPDQVTVRDFSFVPASASSYPACSNLKIGEAWAGVGTYCGLSAAPVAAPMSAATATPTPTTTATPTPVTSATTSQSSPVETIEAIPLPAPTSVPTAKAPVASELIKISQLTTKNKKQYTTSLKWTGAVGTNVTVIMNGVKKIVPNTGNYRFYSNKASTTYQVCDTAGCSAVLKVETP